GPQAARALPRTRATVAYLWPARGVVTSRFGTRWRRHHTGVDIAAPRGTPIHAARDGRVVRAGWYGGYGLVVVLDHGDGMETWYGHASAVLVRVGQQVDRGQVIGRVGCTGACTGPHVHFEVRVRGQPVNPLRYLP
ncbi:MAG: M23 family metallopeptidase, partial [Armatimonadota bacterium]|nr:M23 family metallopeptidase [Armatimonadota bacterium]